MKSSYLLFIPILLLSFIASAQTISTYAGNGSPGYSGDGSAATSAQLFGIGSIAVDAKRNLYISDGGNFRIRKITPGGIISTIAGSGTAGNTGDGGPATAARIGGTDTAGAIVAPGLAIDNLGNLYIADGANNVIRKVDTAGIITKIAGTGVKGFSGDGFAAYSAQLHRPQGMSFDSSGNLYFADCYNQRIRKISASGTISTVAGDTVAGYNGDGGPATAASLRFPFDVAADAAGNLFIADLENNCIREVSTVGIITTVAGTTVAGHTGDGGAATAALLNHPVAVALDGLGNLYVTDHNNSYVRRIDPSGVISAFAGNTAYGYSGDGGAATAATMKRPKGVAIDKDEFVFVSDDDDVRVRKVALITPISGPLTLCSGTTVILSNATGPGTWSSSNTNVATALPTSGIIYGVHPGTTTITYATAKGNATVPVTVTGPTLSSAHALSSLCSDGMIVYTPSCATAGATFAWTRSFIPGLGNPATSGVNNIMEQLTNVTNISITAVYVYTITTTGCVNTEEVRVIIHPVPRLSSDPTPPAICDSIVFNYYPTGYTAGSSFAWSRPARPGIANAASTGMGNPAELLMNTTALPVDVFYLYVLTANGCTNPDADTVTLTVNPCNVSVHKVAERHALQLHPNPADDKVTISYDGSISDKMVVTLYDATGRNMGTVTSNENTVTLHVKNYPPGVYACKIYVDGVAVFKKVVRN